MHLSLSRCHSPEEKQPIWAWILRKQNMNWNATPAASTHLPVALVQLDHLIFQLFSVIRCKAKLADIVTAVLIRVVVTKLRLHSIGAQQGKGDKGAGQPARHDVISQLQAEVVPAKECRHCSHTAPPAPSAKEPLLRGRKYPSPKFLALARIKN